MKAFIEHESRGRLRVRMKQYRMTLEQADLLEAYLQNQPGVLNAAVHERTCCAVIRYIGDRENIIRAIAQFNYTAPSVTALTPTHSGRALNREYQEKLVGKVITKFACTLFLPTPLQIARTIWLSLPFLGRGLKRLIHRELKVELLDALSIGVSMVRRDFSTAGSVMFLLDIGELLEEWTHKKSVDDLARCMSLNVKRVWLKTDDAEVLVPLSNIAVGDHILVRMGNVIPLDGEVVEGEVMVNQASLTGESMPVAKRPGTQVYAGTVIEEGDCVIEVTQSSGESRYDKIVSMIEQSEQLKSAAESHAANLADKLVPYTLIGSALSYALTRNVTRALSVLMVDFSCALKLAMPLAVLSAMREASMYHITVKGGKFLEAVAQADTIVFDKTGTLTHACPVVARVIPFGGHSADDMLRVAACLEEHFPHPVARAVVRCAQEEGLQHEEEHAQVEYVVAHGIASTLYGKAVRVGSRHYIECDEGIDLSPLEAEIDAQAQMGRSLLYLAIDGKLAGFLAIEDPLRPECPQVLKQLEELGFRRILMLTGDDERTARAVAGKLGLKEYRAQVLPADKADVIADLTAQGCKVLMVGDGINDAPALSASHVGVAMCDGADLAREVANVLLTRPDLSGLITARLLGRATLRRIHVNFAATMLLNSMFLAGGLFMILTPGVSALLHNLTTLGVTLNAMRPHLPGRHARQLEAA